MENGASKEHQGQASFKEHTTIGCEHNKGWKEGVRTEGLQDLKSRKEDQL